MTRAVRKTVAASCNRVARAFSPAYSGTRSSSYTDVVLHMLWRVTHRNWSESTRLPHDLSPIGDNASFGMRGVDRHALSVLQEHRHPGSRQPCRRRGWIHPPPPGLLLLREAVHHDRADAADRGQALRRDRTLRP